MKLEINFILYFYLFLFPHKTYSFHGFDKSPHTVALKSRTTLLTVIPLVPTFAAHQSEQKLIAY